MADQKSQARRHRNPPGVSPLTPRTLVVGGRAVQVRLEPSYWEALEEISRREELTVDELCSDLKDRLDMQGRYAGRGQPGVSIANAVRVFVVGYFRTAATEKGHTHAGHGKGDPFISTPFDASVRTAATEMPEER